MQDFLNRLGVDINVSFDLIFFSLIWVRCLAMAAVLPFLFGKPVPRMVMVGASAALAVFAYPHLMPETQPMLADNLLYLVMLYLKEAFYGFVIGFTVSILFHAFQSVGQMIDNQRGVSIARVLIPQLGEQGSLSGMFLFQFAMVLYLSFGGHLVFLDGFFMSYKSLPVLEFPVAGPGMFSLIDLLGQITGQIFMISLQLAAPVIIAILLTDIILGIANRVAPQINVWELGFNVKGYIGVLLLFVSITMIGTQVYHYTSVANLSAEKAVWYLEGNREVPEEEAPHEDGFPKAKDGVQRVITQ